MPIGLPLDRLFTARTQAEVDAVHARYATVPQTNYKPFMERNSGLTQKVEPPNAQQIYTVLDSVMQAVLTRENVDIGHLLGDAAKKVDSILATVK